MNTFAASTEMTLTLAHHTGAARIATSAVPADVLATQKAQYRAMQAERRAQVKAARRARRSPLAGIVTALGHKRLVASAS